MVSGGVSSYYWADIGDDAVVGVGCPCIHLPPSVRHKDTTLILRVVLHASEADALLVSLDEVWIG